MDRGAGGGCRRGAGLKGGRRVPAELALAPCRGLASRSVGALRGAIPPSWVKEELPPMNPSLTSLLPHHRLGAYGTALCFLGAVREARVRDRTLSEQALRAAKSVCLNIAEGAGRVTRADKARAYTIARGELIEAIAAIEIAHQAR